MLQDRIVTIQRFMAQHTAKGWRQLWQDSKYTEKWYAFWALLVIGGLSIFLSIVQMVLQAVQVAIALKSMNPCTCAPGIVPVT
jgi:hypothetical protein